MEHSALNYAHKLELLLNEAAIHIKRVNEAVEELNRHYSFPIDSDQFQKILSHRSDLAFADQMIYRFSKAQDTIGAKVFKAFFLFQGENVDKPFLDLLNQLEKLHIVDVDEWFLLREVRNNIAHEYESNQQQACEILNAIDQHRHVLTEILTELREKSGLNNSV